MSLVHGSPSHEDDDCTTVDRESVVPDSTWPNLGEDAVAVRDEAWAELDLEREDRVRAILRSKPARRVPITRSRAFAIVATIVLLGLGGIVLAQPGGSEGKSGSARSAASQIPQESGSGAKTPRSSALGPASLNRDQRHAQKATSLVHGRKKAKLATRHARRHRVHSRPKTARQDQASNTTSSPEPAPSPAPVEEPAPVVQAEAPPSTPPTPTPAAAAEIEAQAQFGFEH
jgi:hypothetical protein